MPVLLLAQGDATSKDMLRHAIEARYGLPFPRYVSKLRSMNRWTPRHLLIQEAD